MALLILKGGLIYVGAFLGLITFVIIAYLCPSLPLAFLIVVTILQEVAFVSVAGIMSLNQIAGLFLFFIVLSRAFVEDQINRLFNPINLSLAIILGVLISSFLLFSHEGGHQIIRHYIGSYVYFLICLLAVRNRKDLFLVVIAYIIGGLVTAFSGSFWNAIFTPMDYISSNAREGIQSSLTPHYIKYAMVCMIPLPLILSFLTNRRIFHRGYYGLLLAIAVTLSLAILISGSRGAVISYFFMVVLFVMFSKMSIYRKIILSSLLFFVPFVLPIGTILHNIFTLASGQDPGDTSTSLRLYVLKQTFNNLDIRSFLWGHGLDNLRYYFGLASHSVWIQIFFELGIIGLGIHLYLLYKTIQIFLRLQKMRYHEKFQRITYGITFGLGISLFVFFFWGLYENVGIMIGSKHLFIMLGTFIAGSRILMTEA